MGKMSSVLAFLGFLFFFGISANGLKPESETTFNSQVTLMVARKVNALAEELAEILRLY